MPFDVCHLSVFFCCFFLVPFGVLAQFVCVVRVVMMNMKKIIIYIRDLHGFNMRSVLLLLAYTTLAAAKCTVTKMMGCFDDSESKRVRS